MIEKFSVSGMSCVNCVKSIENALNNIEGISSVTISLIEKEMKVDYDQTKVSVEKIIAVVNKAGYDAEVYSRVKIDKFSDAKRLKKRFLVSLIFLLPLVYLCIGAMFNAYLPNKKILFILQWILATIILGINRKFYINGVKAVINRSPNMDTLVSIGSFSAYVYSVAVTLALLFNKANPEHTFFEASAMVLTLVTLGKWLEELSKIKTGDAVEKLGNFMPKVATVKVDEKEEVVLLSQLNVGDIIVIKVGEYVCVDGVVIEGTASVDKSAITGESLPVFVSVGAPVTSGSIIKSGYILVKAEKVGEQTLFSKIVERVKSAGASKAPIQKFADKVSAVFVPVVTVISLITFLSWLIFAKDIYSAFNYGISVLVVSCPCALGLATPVAVIAATGKSATNGILFKNAEALQNTCKIDCVLLDKTATITEGKLKVTGYYNFTGESNQTLYPIISALESKSNHPLSQAISTFCGQTDKRVTDYENVIGKGIIGCVDGVKYFLGNKEILPKDILPCDIPEDFINKSLIYFADEIQLVSLFSVEDIEKQDSKITISQLNEKGIKTVMLTGDNAFEATRIAGRVGIKEFHAEVLPDEKFSFVEDYKRQGYFVAMVGDGINDSPALKVSDVGVAMGTGTDIAIDSAEVVIVNGNLNALNTAINISKDTLKIIKQNLFWAFFYNVLGIPVAAGAFSFIGITLTPMIASAMMSLSSLFVVTNALRLTDKKKKAVKQSNTVKNTVLVGVDGMFCLHCASKLETALTSLDGVEEVSVDLDKKMATLTVSSKVAEKDIKFIIENLGFQIREIK